MIFQIPPYWQLALDGLQIVLCLLILFLIIATRIRGRRPAAESTESEHCRNFNARLLSESIQQQTDQAFDNILTVITSERRNLDRLLQLLAAGQAGADFTGADWEAAAAEPGNSEDRLPDDQLKIEVTKLADSGKDARQISRQLKIPIGEVELILNLTKKSA